MVAIWWSLAHSWGGRGDSPAVGLGNVLESQGPIKISFSCGRSSAIQIGWKQYDHFCQITAGPPSIFVKWSYLMKKCQPPSGGSNTKMRMRHLCTSILLKTKKFNFFKTPHVAYQSTRNLTLISKMYTFICLS